MVKKPTCEELDQRNRELEKEAIEHQWAEGALQKSKERFRSVVENSPDIIHIAIKPDLDNSMDKTTRSPPSSEPPIWAERYGYSKEEHLRYIKALDATRYRGTGRYNVTAAARQLGIPRKTFTYRLRKMRIIK
jgi:transcriptional regulator of acetoin/glycerol metabolism